MIIVSQNKKVILNFDNIINLKLEEYIKNMDGEREIQVQAITDCGDYCVLAYYETEERAKEVFQDIISRYEAIQLTKMSNKDYGYTLQDYIPVYEMPKE